MKKFLATILAVCMIVTSVIIAYPMTAVAAGDAITVNDVASLKQAFKDVADGGTIIIDGTVAFPNADGGRVYFGSGNGKTFTVTGGSLDFTALNSNTSPAFIMINDNVTFENTTLVFDTSVNDFLFACGYNLKIAETVTFGGGKVCVYGGRYLHHNPVYSDKSINVTLLAGKYTSINGASHTTGYSVENDVHITVGGNVTAEALNGGGNTIGGNVYVTVGGNADIKTICGGGGTIKGSTYVTVKDNANPNAAPSNDSHNGGGYYIYGGGNGTVEGSTHVYFMDNAKSGYVVGGTSGTNGTIGGTANVYMMGGTTYSVYGSGTKAPENGGAPANIVMTGGTAWQVLGGCESASVKGDITIRLLGGTVKRRVFGGCYNEYETSGEWQSSYSVTGTINLVLGSDAAVDFSSQESGILGSLKNDHALSAHSRRVSVDANEKGHIIYIDSAAQSEFNNSLKTGMVAGGNPYDEKHLYTYSFTDNVITQTCSEHADLSATATITASADITTPISIEYGDGWEFEKLSVGESANNLTSGEASVTFIIEDITDIKYSYAIDKATRGDVIDDNGISLKDLIVLRRYIAGVEDATVTNGADVNADGVIDSRDIILLRQYMVNYDYATEISSVTLEP